MFCPKCGMANADSAQFCNKCGSPLRATRPTAPSSGPIPGALPQQYANAGMAVPYAGPTETSGKAIGSLICGIFFFVLPSAILAIILGHWSHSDIRKSGGRLTGRGAGTAGMILGYIGVASIPLVLIVAAIAIPNILRARAVANEAAAVNTLRAMNTALVTYGAEYGNGFPTNSNVLTTGDPAAGNCNHAALLDRSYDFGSHHGYNFYYTPVYPGDGDKPAISPKAAAANCTSAGASGYQITADPIPGPFGYRHFYTDQTGLIRFTREDHPATADSDPIE